MNLASLLAERTALIEKWKSLTEVSETREWTPEETATVADIQAKVKDLDQRIEMLEKDPEPTPDPAPQPDQKNSLPRSPEFITRAQANGEAFRSARGRQTPQGFGIVSDYNDRKAKFERRQALRGWLLGNAANDEQRSAMRKHRLYQDGALDLTAPSDYDREERAAQTITTTGGGYTVATDLIPELEKKLAYYNPFRQWAKIIPTTHGNPFNYPSTDDTSNTAADASINTATSETAVVFGQIPFSAYKKSTEILVPTELAEDTGIDLETELADLLGERHGRKEQSDWTVGSGSSAPQGIVTGATTGKTTASATAIAPDEIIDLFAALDPVYLPDALVMMNPLLWAYVSKLKDSQGRYLVGDLGSGSQPTLRGAKVQFNSAMASTVATGNKTILLFQPKKFAVRLVRQRELIRDTSRFVREDQILFKLKQRYDSRVLQAAAVQLLLQA